jgi:ribosome biogenesis GTPase A
MEKDSFQSWYPGHIAKAERELKAIIKSIDLIIELRDARIPFSSCHNELAKWAGSKQIITVLGKADLANPQMLKGSITNLEAEYLNHNNYLPKIFTLDIKSKAGIQSLTASIEANVRRLNSKYQRLGINRPSKIMIVGYPNVGKSSLINLLAKANKTKVENRPGVTKQQQWVDIKSKLNIKLLDTPGIIPPKLYSRQQAVKLALCQCLSDKAFDSYEVAKGLLELIGLEDICAAYDLEPQSNADDILIALQSKRTLNDSNRAAELLINDWRKLKFGHSSLDMLESI